MSIRILKLNLFLVLIACGNFADAHDGILSVGGDDTCVIDDEGVKCWGENYPGQTNVPALKNPTSVSAGYDHACAIDDEGAKCWGSNGYGKTNVPPLKNPTSISAGGYHTCAIDNEGVKCWGLNYYGQTNVPILKNPTFISSGQHSACAIDDEGVKCWGRNDEGQTDVPFLKHPISVSAGGYHTCAIDDEGVKCWGQNSNGQTDVPHLQNPTFVSAGSWHTCAIDDEGVKCWGAGEKTKFPIPTFKNPTSVSAGSSRSCAIDEEGVKCWGIFYYGQANIPSLFFFEDNRLEIFIYQLAYWSTSVRTSFFSSLKTFMNNNLKTTEVLPVPDQLVHGRYIFTAFLKTSIETGDSVVNIENIIPAYIAKIKKITEKTGIQNLDHVKDYPLTRLTALKIMQASLSTMTEFLKAEDKAHIQDVIKLIGTAMTDVSSKQLINNALAAIDTNEPIINKLTQSPKTQFLVLTLKTAQQWLNTKIK